MEGIVEVGLGKALSMCGLEQLPWMLRKVRFRSWASGDSDYGAMRNVSNLSSDQRASLVEE